MLGAKVMVFNATFNNISVILWWSVLLVEETELPGENHQTATSHWQTLSHTVELHSLELEGTVKICSSYRGPVILERKKSGSDPGQFHYVMITDAQ